MTECILINPMILQVDSEDSDQTAHLRSLIRVFAVRTCHKIHFFTFGTQNKSSRAKLAPSSGLES